MVNQLSGLYVMLRDINVFLAQIVTGSLALLILVLFLSPIWLILKLPKPIRKPINEIELRKYRDSLVVRLRQNKHLKERDEPVNHANLDQSLSYLNEKADSIIRETATMVFLTTSVSQNGKLDALTVFSTQMRMVWKIAHIYYQRPSLREVLQLYSFVGLNTIVASEIEDLDISQQIEPIVGAMFKNASGRSVPLLGPSATIVLDSLLEGSTNAYLTLRVGITARKYCGNADIWNKEKIKKETFRESASQLKKIVVSASGKIISGIVSATKNAGVDTLKSSWRGIRNTTGKVVAAGSRIVGKKKDKDSQLAEKN